MPSLLQSSLFTTCSRNIEKVIENLLKYNLNKMLGLRLPKSILIVDFICDHGAGKKRQDLNRARTEKMAEIKFTLVGRIAATLKITFTLPELTSTNEYNFTIHQTRWL